MSDEESHFDPEPSPDTKPAPSLEKYVGALTASAVGDALRVAVGVQTTLP